MQPVEIGSAVKYFRTHPKEESFDAILLAYDILAADADTDAVPSAKLAFIEAKNHHLLRDASWPDAFTVVNQVQHQPTGEFYHGWSESADAHHLAQLEAAVDQGSDALFAKDAEIAQLKRQYGDHGQGETPDYPALRAKLNDYKSTFYGPHPCSSCGLPIIKNSAEAGGAAYLADINGNYNSHTCDPADVKQWSESKLATVTGTVAPQPSNLALDPSEPPERLGSGVAGQATETALGSDNLRQMPEANNLGPTA